MFRTLASSLVSTVIGLIFIIFNGILGAVYGSVWNGTICIYYILLTAVRGTIVFFQRKDEYRKQKEGVQLRKKVSRYTHIVLLILNISLIVPIAAMVEGERTYDFGLKPAIAMAAYTFYRVIFSVINLKKSKQEYNCLVRELRAINMIDTLVAVLSTQNALIIANEGIPETGIISLSAYTSPLLFGLIVVVTVRSMIVNRE